MKVVIPYINKFWMLRFQGAESGAPPCTRGEALPLMFGRRVSTKLTSDHQV